jgi:hypothetical protein
MKRVTVAYIKMWTLLAIGSLAVIMVAPVAGETTTVKVVEYSPKSVKIITTSFQKDGSYKITTTIAPKAVDGVQWVK